MRVYLSGPMTGLPDLNYPAFEDATNSLTDGGFEVYNPATWERENNDGVFNLRLAFADYAHYIIREADVVIALPGWEKSPGATAEIALAQAIGKATRHYCESVGLGARIPPLARRGA